MASTQLTDEELFLELKRFGFTPGPVTENTRPVYLKKLKKLREEQQQRGLRPGKTRTIGAINSTTGGGSTVASRPVSHDVTHLNTSRRPGRKSSLLGFSSDESDAETPLKRKGLGPSGRANRSSSSQQQPKIRPASPPSVAIKSRYDHSATPSSNFSLGQNGERRVSLGWGVGDRPSPDAGLRRYDDSGDEDNYEEDMEKKSRSLNGRGASRLNASKLAGDYSDSDEEEVSGLGVGDPECDRLEPRRNHPSVALSSDVTDRGSATDGQNTEATPRRFLSMGGSRGEDEEEDDLRRRDYSRLGDSRSHTLPRKPIYRSLTENHKGNTGKNSPATGEDGASRSNSTELRPHFSTYSGLSQTYRRNHSTHTPVPNHSYGHAALKRNVSAPEDELLQQFKREELASSGSFSAHYLSMFLLTAACLFFVLLGLMYLRMRGSGAMEVDNVSEYLGELPIWTVMHAVVLLPGNVFKCLFFVYFEWMFLLNKHQSWRDSQIQTDPKMSIFRLAGICTVSLPKHRTAVGRGRRSKFTSTDF